MRAFLGGREIPREEFAIVGVGESTGVPVVLLPANGDTFIPEDYISLGYTNYDIVCIGAAGGRGGDWTGKDECRGGAGGGGGLHHVSGLLADLPSSVAIAIGQGGADGSNSGGGIPIRGELTPAGQFNYILDADGFAVDLELIAQGDHIPPLAGADGGGSSFGSICRASGGKGGQQAQLKIEDPHPLWGAGYSGGYGGLKFSYYFIPGEGGEGGVGDRDIAGGGGDRGLVNHTPIVVTYGPEVVTVYASGYTTTRLQEHEIAAVTTFVKPKDGTWDGNIGKGGGGGHGGSRIDDLSFGTREAAGGARGSMNFGDTSVFGPGELPHYDNQGKLTYPGGGGGARLNKLARYGSHAPAYNPNGVVQIRLTKIE